LPSGITIESVELISGNFKAGCLRAYGGVNPSMNMIVITENKLGVSFSYSLNPLGAYIKINGISNNLQVYELLYGKSDGTQVTDI
jgi:hypothetical protein